jgi:hypothetical protein
MRVAVYARVSLSNGHQDPELQLVQGVIGGVPGSANEGSVFAQSKILQHPDVAILSAA